MSSEKFIPYYVDKSVYIAGVTHKGVDNEMRKS